MQNLKQYTVRISHAVHILYWLFPQEYNDTRQDLNYYRINAWAQPQVPASVWAYKIVVERVH